MGRLADDLAAHQTIGVDTAPFIYLWERHPEYEPLSAVLFDRLSTPGVQGVTSVVSLIEVCVQPRRLGRLDLVAAYRGALMDSEQLRTLHIDEEIALRAVDLRAAHNLRVPDALQIAASLSTGATAFVTNDRRLARVHELSVIVLDDYIR